MTDVLEDVGTITATWTDPTGVVWPLSDTSDDVGWFTTNGPAGWHATSYEIVSDPLPRGGEQVRFIRSKPGTITWPMYVWGDSHLQYVERHRQLRRAFLKTMHLGLPGVLRVERPDGSARTVECYYQAGLEGQAGEGWLWSKDAITLWCPDGYWRDETPITVTHSYVPGSDFLSPFPTISEGLSLGETQLDNPGDVQAWPYWEIIGPIVEIAVTNVTTGYSFSLDLGISAGELITVSTDRPMVRGPNDQNYSSSLNWPNAYLWSLSPGVNDVVLNVTGADVGTSVTVTYHPRYEGA